MAKDKKTINCNNCKNYEPRPKRQIEIELWEGDYLKRHAHCILDLPKTKQATTYVLDLPDNLEQIARDGYPPLQVRVRIYP